MTQPSNNKIVKTAILAFSSIALVAIAGIAIVQSNVLPKLSSYFSESDVVEAGPFRIAVAINPESPRVGANKITITVRDKNKNPVTGAAVRAVAQSSAMGVMSLMETHAAHDPDMHDPDMRGPDMHSRDMESHNIESNHMANHDMQNQGMEGHTHHVDAMQESAPHQHAAHGNETQMHETHNHGATHGATAEANTSESNTSKDNTTEANQEHAMHGAAMDEHATHERTMNGAAMDEPVAHNHSAHNHAEPEHDSMAGHAMPNETHAMHNATMDSKAMNLKATDLKAMEPKAMDQHAMHGATPAAEKINREDMDAESTDMAITSGHSHEMSDGDLEGHVMHDAEMHSHTIQARMREVAPGIYEGELNLPMAGDWALAVDVATDAQHHADLTFDMATGRAGISLAVSTPVGDVAYHTCSMHPSVKAAAAGNCPICGMKLIPISNDELSRGTVRVDRGRRQRIGLKTGKVSRKPFMVPLRLQGRLTFDESKLVDINMRFHGWVEELNVNYEGQEVKRGDALFVAYSPELAPMQRGLLHFIENGGSREDLFFVNQNRILSLGMTAEQIDWLLKSDEQVVEFLPVFSPVDGVIVKKNVVLGSSFAKGEQLLQLADVSTVWVEAFVYERDLPLVREGMSATVELTNQQQRLISAKVIQIDDFIAPNSRTCKIRLSINNSQGLIKPGQLATVKLMADLGDQLVIPEDSVLISGKKRIVFLDEGEDRLRPVAISTSYSNGFDVIVNNGLSQGDIIVTSGNFLIAAESKLRSGIEQW